MNSTLQVKSLFGGYSTVTIDDLNNWASYAFSHITNRMTDQERVDLVNSRIVGKVFTLEELLCLVNKG